MTDIVENPVAVKFKNQNVDPPTKIDCDILFYTKDENAVIHLGIKRMKYWAIIFRKLSLLKNLE